MKLADWLAREKITQQALADQLGVTQGRVSQISRDGTDSVKIAVQIRDLTDGEVTIDDLMREDV